MKLSVCYIVRDEVQELARSLASLGSSYDDLVVVCTRENAAVRTMAEQYGARIFSFPWRDDFSAARNYAIEQAMGDWILFLDADEFLAPGIAAHLSAVLAENAQEEALLLRRLDIEGDTSAPEKARVLGDIYVLRLFRRLPSLRFCYRIHEELRMQGAPVRRLRCVPDSVLLLYHTGYDGARGAEKAARNLRLLERALKEESDPGRLYGYLAEACHGVGDDVRAEQYARLDIARGRQPVTDASRSHRLLLSLLAGGDRQEERLAAAEAAVRDFPELPEFRAELAACLAACGRYAEAVRALETAFAALYTLPRESLEPQMFDAEEQEKARRILAQWRALTARAGSLTVAACLIMRDESARLPAWLAQAKVYGDTVVCVDTGSSDGSAALARQAGAQVLSFPWQGDFAAARNAALAAVPAGTDWIVFLDADETFVSPTAVRGLLARQAPGTEALLVPIINVDHDAQDLEISRFSALRIFRAHDYYRYQGAVHETLIDLHTGQAPRAVLVSSLRVRHTGYSSDRVQQKLRRNLALLQEEVRQHGEQPLTARYLADCYYGLGDDARAIACARRALAGGQQTVAGNRDLYSVLLRALRRQKAPREEQQAVVAAALAESSAALRQEFSGWQGCLLVEEGKFREALPWFDRFFQEEMESAGEESSGAPALRAEFLAQRGRALFRIGRREQAESSARAALRENPYEEAALALCADLCTDGESFLRLVLGSFPSEARGASFLTDWAERCGRYEVRQAALAHLSPEERETRQPVQALYEAAARGDYEAAAREALAPAGIYVQELFAALVLLPEAQRAEQSARCAEWRRMLPTPLGRVIARLYGELPQLSPSDWDGYVTGLTALEGMAPPQAYVPYARLALDFSWERSLDVAETLLGRQASDAAWQLLSALPKTMLAQPELAGRFWYLTGAALAARGDATARECFERACAAGEERPELAAYLHWLGVAEREEERL